MWTQQHVCIAMAGSAILTVGALALAAHFASAISRERTLLLFGLFAAPYGLALVLRSSLVPEVSGLTDFVLTIVVRLIGVAATIPALLLIEEFYGTGCRLSFRWLIWAYGLAGITLFVLVGAYERPDVAFSPGVTLVILVPLVLIVDRLTGYTPPIFMGRPVIFGGLGVFFLTFAYDQIAHPWISDRPGAMEPFGFFVLTLCLGIIVAQRVAKREAEWISMNSEMQAARKIQASILPTAMPQLSTWTVAARYVPMTVVAGDFYGFPHVGEDTMEIVVADAMGHGVPAALVASMVKVSVFSECGSTRKPGEIIGNLNSMLCAEVPGEYVTAVYVSLRRDTREGSYSAAGQPPPLLWHAGTQSLEILDNPGLLLGVRREENFTTWEFQFEKGDRLLIYSDGLTDAENSAGMNYRDQLPGLLASRQVYAAEEFADAMLKDVLDWSSAGVGPGQQDDITFVVVDLG